MEVNCVIEFNEDLYTKNLADNNYPDASEYGGLASEDFEDLKKEGLI